VLDEGYDQILSNLVLKDKYLRLDQLHVLSFDDLPRLIDILMDQNGALLDLHL